MQYTCVSWVLTEDQEEGRDSSCAPPSPLPGISRRARTCSKGLVNRPGVERHQQAAEVAPEGEVAQLNSGAWEGLSEFLRISQSGLKI